jgi:hypothetical protein
MHIAVEADEARSVKRQRCTGQSCLAQESEWLDALDLFEPLDAK